MKTAQQFLESYFAMVKDGQTEHDSKASSYEDEVYMYNILSRFDVFFRSAIFTETLLRRVAANYQAHHEVASESKGGFYKAKRVFYIRCYDNRKSGHLPVPHYVTIMDKSQDPNSVRGFDLIALKHGYRQRNHSYHVPTLVKNHQPDDWEAHALQMIEERELQYVRHKAVLESNEMKAFILRTTRHIETRYPQLNDAYQELRLMYKNYDKKFFSRRFELDQHFFDNLYSDAFIKAGVQDCPPIYYY